MDHTERIHPLAEGEDDELSIGVPRSSHTRQEQDGPPPKKYKFYELGRVELPEDGPCSCGCNLLHDKLVVFDSNDGHWASIHLVCDTPLRGRHLKMIKTKDEEGAPRPTFYQSSDGTCPPVRLSICT